MPPKQDNRVGRDGAKINWCFRMSIEEDEDFDEQAAELYAKLIDCCDAFIFQLESAPTTGYLHFQGYMSLTNRKRHGWLLKNIYPFEYLKPMQGKPHQAWAYASKEETRVLGPWILGECPTLNQKKDANEVYRKALAAPTLRDGLAIIKEEKPRDYCLYGDRISKNIVEHLKPPPQPFKKRFELNSFIHAPLDLKNKTSLVYGPSNTGKTSFVKAHFENPLVVSHMDTLKKFNGHDAIIFDDMSFQHCPPEAVIHLVDQDDDRDIHVRYSTAFIPANTTKVFTHNRREIFYKAEVDEEQKMAIDRRVNYFHVPNKLFAIKAISLVPPQYATHTHSSESEED